MKTVNVYLRTYFYGIPVLGKEIYLGKRWKTVIENDEYYLLFEDTEGHWWYDYSLIVVTREEFLNECSDA